MCVLHGSSCDGETLSWKLKCLDASHLDSFISSAAVEEKRDEVERSWILVATLMPDGATQVTDAGWERKNMDGNNKKVLGGGELSCARQVLPPASPCNRLGLISKTD